MGCGMAPKKTQFKLVDRDLIHEAYGDNIKKHIRGLRIDEENRAQDMIKVINSKTPFFREELPDNGDESEPVKSWICNIVVFP